MLTSPEVSITINTVVTGEGAAKITYYVADVYVGAMPTVEIVSHEKTDYLCEEFVIKVDFYEDPAVMLTDMPYVSYAFDLYSGWYVSDSRQERVSHADEQQEVQAEDWRMTGTYVLKNDRIDAIIWIEDFALLPDNQYRLSYSYEITSYISNDDLFGGPKMRQGETYTGSHSLTCDRGFESEYVSLNVDGLFNMFLCGESINWDPIGPGTGVWIQIRSNYAETYGEYWMNG